MAEVAQAPTYAATYQEAKGVGRTLIQRTIGVHPLATSLVIAVLVLLIIILWVALVHYKAKVPKSGFQMINTPNNLNTGGNNPQWQMGSMDAGSGGPLDRRATPWNVAAWNPSWRDSNRPIHMAKEGLSGPSPSGSCEPGEVPVVDPDSGQVYCRPFDPLPGPAMVCGAPWDPAAMAEAQAVTAAGANLSTRVTGERRLQEAIEGTMDDNQLMALVQEGGTM